MIDDINLSEEPEHEEEGSTESQESTEEPKVSAAFLGLELQKPSYENEETSEEKKEDEPNAQDDDNDFERDNDFEEDPNVKEDDDEVIQKVKLEVQINITGVNGKESKVEREEMEEVKEFMADNELLDLLFSFIGASSHDNQQELMLMQQHDLNLFTLPKEHKSRQTAGTCD